MPQINLSNYINEVELTTIIQHALAEDVGSGDATCQILFPDPAPARAELIAKYNGVVCGLAVAETVFRTFDANLDFHSECPEGQLVSPRQRLATISGNLSSLLTAERTALNFIQRLSGIATATKAYTKILEPYHTQLLDTRKTVPGLRMLDKYAVACGGGKNHRIGLFDAIMIKDNHVAACGGIKDALDRCFRNGKPRVPVVIEVTNREELNIALQYPVDQILLDNFTPEVLAELVKEVRKIGTNIKLEASGGITLDTIAKFAASRVDFISVGAITHSVKAADISMEYLN